MSISKTICDGADIFYEYAPVEFTRWEVKSGKFSIRGAQEGFLGRYLYGAILIFL